MMRTEVLVHHVKVRAILPRLIINARAAGSEIAALLPSKVACWWPIIEDIFFSPAARIVPLSIMCSVILQSLVWVRL